MAEKQGFIRYRYMMCAMIFFGIFFVYSMRTNLSVTIIAMVKADTSGGQTGNVTDGTCPAPGKQSDGELPVPRGNLDWDGKQQSYALLAFFAGYITTQLIGGVLSEMYSVKTIFGLSILCTSVLTLITEVMAKWNIYAFIALRVLEGCTEGIAYPAIYGLMARWAPKQECSTMLNLSLIGANVGTIVTLPVAAALCQSALVWPAAFYIPAALGIVWSILWFVVAASAPENHPWISGEEKRYIVSGRELALSTPKKIPWGKIVTSRAVWTLSIAEFAYSLTFYIFLTEMPTFLNNVFHIDLMANGSLNAVFYLCSSISGLFSGMLADRMIHKYHFQKTTVRKIFEAGSSYLTTAILITVISLGCDYAVISVLLCVAMLTLPLVSGGNLNLPIDLAPNMAGSVMGFANMIANLSGVAAPFLVGQLTSENASLAEWHLVFCITAAISVAGSTTFLIFGTADEQDWAKASEDDEELKIEVNSLSRVN